MTKSKLIEIINMYQGQRKDNFYYSMNDFEKYENDYNEESNKCMFILKKRKILTTIEIEPNYFNISEQTCEYQGGASMPYDKITESELIGYMEKWQFKRKEQEQLTLF